jgi:hypothetical protein
LNAAQLEKHNIGTIIMNRLAADQKTCAEYIEMRLDENEGAPKPTDVFRSPPGKRKAGACDDIQSDANLAAVLNKTELMVLNFHQHCGFSQLWGQALMDMVRHLEFKPEILQPESERHHHQLVWSQWHRDQMWIVRVALLFR